MGRGHAPQEGRDIALPRGSRRVPSSRFWGWSSSWQRAGSFSCQSPMREQLLTTFHRPRWEGVAKPGAATAEPRVATRVSRQVVAAPPPPRCSPAPSPSSDSTLLVFWLCPLLKIASEQTGGNRGDRGWGGSGAETGVSFRGGRERSPRAEPRALGESACPREIRVYHYTTDWLGFGARDWTRRPAPRFMHGACC